MHAAARAVQLQLRMRQVGKVVERTGLAVGSALLALALSPACGHGELGRGAQTTNSNGVVPRPATTGVTTRTIDNAGFVDNGGRTSDETNRSEMSGARATELGSERPTGTPGAGAPLPIEREPPRVDTEAQSASAAAAAPRAPGPAPSGAPASEAVSRIAAARCDRDLACAHGAAHPSRDSCMEMHRGRAQSEVDALGCTEGVASAQLAACLNAVRLEACAKDHRTLDTFLSCQSAALCVR